MNKQEFFARLEDRLSALPQDEVQERLGFLNEMIEDRMEEGLSEEEAVAAAGSVEEVADGISADIPFVKIAKEKIKPKRPMRVWEIVLLVLGSPVWLSLLIAAASVAVSLYLSWWAVLVSLWAVFASLIACAVGGVVAGVVLACTNGLVGVALIGAGIALLGLSVFCFFGCKVLTSGTVRLTSKAFRPTYYRVKKEGAQ